MADTTVNFDDVCLVCGTTRDMHGDKYHQFSLTSDVPVEIKPGPEGRKPPEVRGENASTYPGPDLKLAFATLVEVLAEKKIDFDGVGRELLTKQDIIRIFSGQG